MGWKLTHEVHGYWFLRIGFTILFALISSSIIFKIFGSEILGLSIYIVAVIIFFYTECDVKITQWYQKLWGIEAKQ